MHVASVKLDCLLILIKSLTVHLKIMLDNLDMLCNESEVCNRKYLLTIK